MSCEQWNEETRTYLGRYFPILGDLITGMTCADRTDSISHNFITQMIPHHEAAIQMSQNLLQYGAVCPLEKIAQNIIAEQTRSIAEMRQALNSCSRLANSEQALCAYQREISRITQRMFSRMQLACAGNNLSATFIRQMLPHHEGAIRMSKRALQFPICPELTPILNAIITSQERGVLEMRRLFHRLTR